MKKVIFPDGKLLQPIPTADGVHANISGNINSTTLETLIKNNQSTLSETNNLPNITPENQIVNQKDYALYTIYILIVLIAVSILIYIAKNRIKR